MPIRFSLFYRGIVAPKMQTISLFIVLISSLFFVNSFSQVDAKKTYFRLHLFSEPSSLSLLYQKNSNSFYFFNQVTCPLLKWDNNELVPGAANCNWVLPGKKYSCEISKNAKFEDGTDILGEHYLKTILQFLTTTPAAPKADLFFTIKNAQAIFLKQKKESELGVKTEGKKIIFELENIDTDFPQDLTQVFYTASKSINESWLSTKTSSPVSCGAYALEEKKSGQYISLKPQIGYPHAHPHRPYLKFIYAAEDSIAYQYYLKNELDFLRRLPTLYLKKWQNSSELITSEQIRLDYLGFNIKSQVFQVSEILAQSIDFKAWQDLYSAKPRPGCFGLPVNFSNKQVCWDYSPIKAKEDLVGLKLNNQKVKLSYSKLGGDDHERTTDFLQEQFKNNLNLNVRVEGLENKIFLQKLENNELDFFRKGIAPTRATCLAALEKFSSESSENYIQFKNNKYMDLLQKLRTTQENEVKLKSKLCFEMLLILKDEAHIIPTGPLYFSMLLKPQWQGVFLNQLNQLDLSQLHLK